MGTISAYISSLSGLSKYSSNLFLSVSFGRFLSVSVALRLCLVYEGFYTKYSLFRQALRRATFILSWKKVFNRPFPSCLLPLFNNESSCKTFLMKMSLICTRMTELTDETCFHNNCLSRSRTRFDTKPKSNSEMT